MKVCSKCKISKSETLFHKRKARKDGLQNACKECVKERDKLRSENKLTWHSLNPEKHRLRNKGWRVANPDKINAKNMKRRAHQLNATPPWANAEFEEFAIQEMYALAQLRTKITGIEHHVDHIVPLQSKIVQGFHCLANLQILEAKANIIKGNRVWPDS